MNHRGIEITDKRAATVAVTLCALCVCGVNAFGATGDWPRLYNTGVRAYRSNDFAQAAEAFENATAARDRAVQQRALYNLGNTDYRLGQAQPQQAQQLWERAVKSYESALALDPNDVDAKFNHDFVKKKLEELKQQKQEQQQQQQNQKNQQNQEQDQTKGDQQQQQQQKPEDKQSEKQQQQSKQSEEQRQKEQEQKQAPQQKEAQQKPATPEKPSQEKGGQPENYDKMQATALLDDLRENERNWNFFPEVQMKDLKDSGPPAKDW